MTAYIVKLNLKGLFFVGSLIEGKIFVIHDKIMMQFVCFQILLRRYSFKLDFYVSIDPTGADKNVELVFILCSINCPPYLITYLMLFKSLLGLFAQES